MTQRDAERFVRDIERRLEPLDRAILLSEWRLATGRSRDGAGRWQSRRRRLLGAPGMLESIRTHQRSEYGGLLGRRLDLLARATLESRIEQDPEIVRRRDRLQSRAAAFRPTWHGRKVNRSVVRRAFRTSADREERRRAFYAEDPVYGPMEDDLRSLVAARNDRARAFGYRTYPEFRLSFDRLSVDRLEALPRESLRRVPAEMRRRRDAFAEATGESGWYPWDIGYAQQIAGGLPESAFPADEALRAVYEGIQGWGFPRSLLRFRVDHHDIPSGGLCLAPDPPRDVRIVVHPGRGGWEDYMVLFHEVGHAVHSSSIRGPTHLLRWHEGLPGFGGFHEGIGEFFAEIAEKDAWLRTRKGLSSTQIRDYVAEHRRAPLRVIAYLAGWIQRELDLYLRPQRDPREAERRYGRSVMAFDDFTPRSFADSFYIHGPIYATSYFVATLLRPQLFESVRNDVGGEAWPNAKIGPWLTRHWFREGSAFDWLPRVREVTGRPFGTRAFNEAMR